MKWPGSDGEPRIGGVEHSSRPSESALTRQGIEVRYLASVTTLAVLAILWR